MCVDMRLDGLPRQPHRCSNWITIVTVLICDLASGHDSVPSPKESLCLRLGAMRANLTIRTASVRSRPKRGKQNFMIGSIRVSVRCAAMLGCAAIVAPLSGAFAQTVPSTQAAPAQSDASGIETVIVSAERRD